MKIKRMFACVLVLLFVFAGNCFAADVVTELLENEGYGSIVVIDGVVNEQVEIGNPVEETFELFEYENGITITAPASTILEAGGTLQLTATITEPTEGESVIWSIESGSNFATIDQNGLVTAITNGTVVCKVHSTVDASKVAYKTIVVSIQTENRSISVDLMGVKCSFQRTVGEEIKKLGSYHIMSYPAGTEFVLTAVPKTNNEFIYWKDSNGKIVSYEPTIEFTLGTEMKLTAVCASIDGSSTLVTFKDISGKVLAEGYTTSEIKVPSNPFTLGYVFHCWVADGNMYNFTPRAVLDVTDISKNTMFTAGYIKDATKYTVTVTGADSEGGEYKYNDLITLNPAEPEEGKRFAYWTRDGKIVSYDETYKFYMGAYDTVVEAVFVGVDEAVAEVPIIVMSEPQVVDTNKISFAAERYLPEQYTLTGTGIILSNSSSNITLETSGILNSRATSTANKGQYTVRKKDVTSSEVWYARAYMIYKDGDNLITVYSDPVSGSLNK